VRTPDEQRHHKLSNASPSGLAQSPYSEAIKRSLKAILTLDDRTKDLTIVFKSGEQADLDLLLEGSNLLINDKWLDFQRSHYKAPCWLSRHGVKSYKMPCDHIVTRLHDLILRELTKGPVSQLDKSTESKAILRLKVSDSLRQMPRMIEISQGLKPHELIATWTMLERDLVFKMYGFDLRCQVTLHRESTCSEKKMDTLFYIGETSTRCFRGAVVSEKRKRGQCANLKAETLKEGDAGLSKEDKGITECGCSYQIVSRGDSGILFQGLDPEEAYFPMVARDYDEAFFGIPPEAIRPTVPQSVAQPVSVSKNVSAENSMPAPAAFQRADAASDDADGATNDTPPKSNFGDEKEGEESPLMVVSSKKLFEEVDKIWVYVLTLTQVNGNSQERQILEDEPTGSIQNSEQETSKKLISELRSALAKLKVKEDMSNSTARKLQVKEQELAAALESLEIKELELRQAKADSDAQKQRLESTIEDLEGEIQQLQETQTETETQCTELSGTIENLRTELEQLRAEKNEIESQVQLRIDAEMSAAGRTGQGAAEEVQQAGEKQMANENQTGESVAEMREQLLEFQASNEVLKMHVGQARADHASIMTTLRGVSGMIKGVLGLGSKEMMVATLQSILGMLRGVLNLDTRVSNPASGTKHARVKEEDDDGGDLANVPKRFRQAEHVDLTEEL
jgi:hypothetical protein